MPEYFNASLKDLGLDYLDMYLMHTPFAFEHVPGDLHPKNPDGSMRVDLSTDLIAVWKVCFFIFTPTYFIFLHLLQPIITIISIENKSEKIVNNNKIKLVICRYQ